LSVKTGLNLLGPLSRQIIKFGLVLLGSLPGKNSCELSRFVDGLVRHGKFDATVIGSLL
jgi:hypothetical protein